ncbi:MAG TPA: UDP-N-acetylglucosamine 2-epimerase, partial [Solirubrobacteraceae bacterium]
RWHWCPTSRNAAPLVAEGIDPAAVAVTGNTVIDAVLSIARRPLPKRLADALPPRRARQRILVTMHRRETLGAEQAALCRMLGEVATARDVEIVFPVHLNPRVREQVRAELAGHARVTLLDPLDYHSFVHLLASSDLAVTDSGGIQEEAPVFGIPVVVMRDATERVEGVEAGAIRLSGTDPERVRADILDLCDRPPALGAAPAVSPYGDGRAAERIVGQLVDDLAGAPTPEPARAPERHRAHDGLGVLGAPGLPATA